MVEAITSPTGTTSTDPAAAGGAPGGAAVPGGAAAGAPAVWTDSITDPAMKDWSINKGYNKFSQAEAAPIIAQQYHSLEKLFGAEKAGKTVEVPDWEKADEATLNAYFERVGRPKDMKEYDLALPKPESGIKTDPEFETWARTNFHKAGLSGRQANAVGKAWNEFAAAQTAKAVAEMQNTFANEDKTLKTEWGAAYDNKLAVAGAAAKSLGIAPEVIDTLQRVAGYGATMKMFANLAEKIGEDKFVGADGANGANGKMTPAEAQAELTKLQADKDWLAAWMDKSNPKHKEAVERKTFLTSMMSAGMAA